MPLAATPLWENPEARRVLDSMGEMFIALDREFAIVFANRALLDGAGFSEDRFVGQKHFDLYPEMVGTRVEEAYRRAFETGIAERFEYHHKPTDVWVDVIAYPVGDYLHIYFTDITSRRKAEEEAAEREQALRALVDAMPHITWVTNADGSMLYINKNWEEYTGVGGLDLDNIRNCIHPADLEPVMMRMAESRRTGEYVPYDVRLRSKDGEYRWFRVKSSPMPGPDGKTARWIGTSTDVHEERLALDSLQESEDHYRFRVLSSPQIPWLADSSGRIYEHSDQWRELTGLSTDEAEGSQFTILHPDDVIPMTERWECSLRTGEPFDLEHRIKSANGDYLWVRSRAVARKDAEGNILRWYGATEVIHDRKHAEEELRRTQESLELALQAGRMGWWTRDLRTEEVKWSPELEALYGLPAGGFKGDESRFLHFVHPDDRRLVFDQVRAAVAEHKDYAIEFRFNRMDGSSGWMEGRGRASYDSKGEPLRIDGIGIDISERKEAEQALRQSEERLRALVNQSPISIQTFAPDGSSLSANPAWQALWGSDLVELGDYNILKDPQVEAKGIAPYVRRAFAGEAQRTPPVLYDPAEIGKVGRVRWVEARIYPISDPDGTVKEVVLLLEDVTAKMQAEEAMRESEERFRTLAETVPNYIWTSKPDGTTDYFNPQFLGYLGKQVEEVSRVFWNEVVHPHDYEDSIRKWNECIVSGEVYEEELRIRGADGEYRWFLVRGVPFRDSEGKITRWFGVSIDVQAQKEQAELLDRLVKERTEELQAAYREQEAFSYSVSHDLRAPLRSIVATSKLIQLDHGETLSDGARELLNTQASSALRLAHLIDDLLELSRVGRHVLEPQEIDLSFLFSRVAESVVPQGIQVNIEQGHKAKGDSRLLTLLAQNLLENAVKFSPNGGTIRFGAKQTERGRAYYVADEGVGFEQEYVHKLFQPFQRLHAEGEFPGTGIGLATVRRIVERHQGEAWAESEPGKGATFYFRLGAP